jgi:hypothetical protein
MKGNGGITPLLLNFGTEYSEWPPTNTDDRFTSRGRFAVTN